MVALMRENNMQLAAILQALIALRHRVSPGLPNIKLSDNILFPAVKSVNIIIHKSHKKGHKAWGFRR